MQATFLEPYKVRLAEPTATFPNVQLPTASNGTAQHHGTMVAKFASFLLAFLYKISFQKKNISLHYKLVVAICFYNKFSV